MLVPFLLLLLGLADMGRGVYTYNAVAQAAREIARVSSVHPYDLCCVPGTSAEAVQVKTTQKQLVPGLTDSGILVECVDLSDVPITSRGCRGGDFIRVTVTAPFSPVTPLLGQLGPFSLRSISHLQLP
ncbi:MAG: pilus assembly protein [Aldersonia sp.]|nr:pilus assembly protein [Aldersonia sp.]